MSFAQSWFTSSKLHSGRGKQKRLQEVKYISRILWNDDDDDDDDDYNDFAYNDKMMIKMLLYCIRKLDRNHMIFFEVKPEYNGINDNI